MQRKDEPNDDELPQEFLDMEHDTLLTSHRARDRVNEVKKARQFFKAHVTGIVMDWLL